MTIETTFTPANYSPEGALKLLNKEKYLLRVVADLTNVFLIADPHISYSMDQLVMSSLP